MLIRSNPESSLLQAKQTQLSQLLLEGLQNLNHLCGLLLDSPQYVHVFLVLVSSKMDIVLQMWSHQHCVVTFLSLLSMLFLIQPKMLVDLLSHKGTLLAYVQLFVHHDTFFFLQGCFPDG